VWAHYSTASMHRAHSSGRRFGPVGTGLPYAIGAKLARPDRRFMRFVGTSVWPEYQELEMPREIESALVVIRRE